MTLMDSFLKQFNLSGYNDGDVVAICEHKGDIVAVKCDDTMSGIYPDYKTAQSIAFGWIAGFKIKHKTDDGETIDAIILQVNHTKNIVEIFFATDTWDGFQLL